MTAAEVLLLPKDVVANLEVARATFLAQPGKHDYFHPEGCVCSVGAIVLARGLMTAPPPELMDEWPEVRALAQAVDELGLRRAGGGFFGVARYLELVTTASDWAVDHGETHRMGEAFDLAVEIERGL